MLLWPSLWNGYPLVFSDTGTYISSAFTLKVPFDRPIGYGCFIRVFSGGVSLWLIIFAQAFLGSYLLWEFLGVFLTTYRFGIHCLSVLFLSLFTALPWFASQLMPDIFPGLIFLLVTVFLFGKIDRMKQVFFILLLPVFLITHSTNFLLVLGFLFFTFIIIYLKKALIQKRKYCLQRIVLLGIVTMVAPLFFLLSNYRQGYGFVLSPSSYAFVMSRVNEAGILETFLQENCQDEHYVLCAYQGSLVRGDGFLWKEDSPLNVGGGWRRWKPEFEHILSRIFRQPRFVRHFIADSFYRSIQLFFMSGIDLSIPEGEAGYVASKIDRFFPHELLDYKKSKQVLGELQPMSILVFVFRMIFLLSIATIFCGWFKNNLSEFEWFLVYEICLYLLLNAIVMGTLSGIYGRYQARVVWLLPCIGFVVRITRNYRAHFST
jgi:hypothetical protein